MQRFLAHMSAIMSRDEPPATKDMQRVGEIVYLRQIGGDQDNPRSGLQQFGKKFVNFGLGADINTRCWFVKDEQLGPMVQPFANDDLLLVAAGEARRKSFTRGRLYLHLADLPVGRRSLGEGVDDACGGQALVDWQIDVESDGEIEAEALIAPAFGHQRDAPRDRILFLANFDRLTLPENLPCRFWEAAEQALHKLTAPRANQSVKPNDLARPDAYGNFLEALAAEVFRPKDLVAEWNRLLVMDLADRSIDHAGDQRLLVGFGNALGRHQLAVAQDRDAVRELEYFFQPMRNIDNGNALGLES